MGSIPQSPLPQPEGILRNGITMIKTWAYRGLFMLPSNVARLPDQSVYFWNATEVLWPPNPNAFETAILTERS